ncbi:MAG TPA: hypothetical protein VF702_02820 [Allosphingosinicella sp.]|jgi:hypothetical protein
MSEPTTAGTSARPLWLACLAGWLVPATIAWIVVLVWLDIDNARLDDGHMFEGDGAVRPPAAFTSAWLQDAATIYARLTIGALAFAIPLALLGPLLERRSKTARRGWLLAGIAAMAPLAAALTAFALQSRAPGPTGEFFALLVLLLCLGAAGGAAAHRVRRKRR